MNISLRKSVRSIMLYHNLNCPILGMFYVVSTGVGQNRSQHCGSLYLTVQMLLYHLISVCIPLEGIYSCLMSITVALKVKKIQVFV